MREIELSDPQADFIESTAAFNLFLAGVGSGKSHVAGLIAADYVINYPHVRGFIGANTYSQLSKSTLDRVFKVWSQLYGWSEGDQYVVDKIPPQHFIKNGPKLKSYDNTISFNNGALIFTASLEKFKAIDGTEFAWAILDETKDTREEAVKEVIMMRLRQPGLYIDKEGQLVREYKSDTTGYTPLYILTSPAKVDWINEWFNLEKFEDEIRDKVLSETTYFAKQDGNNFVVISSTFHNSHNLAPGYIEQKIEALRGNEQRVKMLIYGYPFAKAGGEFWKKFERSKHVKATEHLPELPDHISLDFNVLPYITMTCWQLLRVPLDEGGFKYQVRCFDEICLPPPDNMTEDLCAEYKRRYLKFQKRRRLVYYYGDPSGKIRTNLSRQHHYDKLRNSLAGHVMDDSDRVLRRHPPVDDSKDFVNKILAGGYKNIEIQIDPKCKNTIADLEFLKEAADGGKLIEHATDSATGAKYEKRGHPSDTIRYFFCKAFEDLYESKR